MLGVLQQTQLQELCAVLAGIGVSWQVRERHFVIVWTSPLQAPVSGVFWRTLCWHSFVQKALEER